MSLLVRLPPAPPHYDHRDQQHLRRVLQQALREIERRLRDLENP